MTFLTLFGSNPDKASNKGTEPTAYSVRSCLAPASGSGSCRALGAFYLVNLYTNPLDRCFTWRYSGA
jgi:hypothetical protein